jgi:hypothetical protein
VVTDPTCTEKGYTTHTCSRCNDTYIDSEVDPRHVPGAIADCENDQVCTVCGVILVEKHHNYDNYLVYLAPTCTQNGGDMYFCGMCMRFILKNEEPAPELPKQFDWDVVVAAEENLYNLILKFK